IKGDEDTTTYSVHKMPTNVSITLPEQVEVFVPFDITVTLTNHTSNTNAISGKPVTITVNGEILSQVPLTDIDGRIVVSYTPQNNSTIVVQAVFDEDDLYLESSDIQRIASENINISNSTITVNVNESSLYVDESVKISGKLTDGLNRPISTADVKVYINDVLAATVETNRNGEYSHVINGLNKGDYDVMVVYEGVDGQIRPCNNTTSYVVSKIPTITNVSVINNTQGNVTIDVVVTENVTGRHTDIISSGALEVTVNGQTEQYPVRGRNTTIVLDGNAFINTTDEVTFNVKYVENDNYTSSNGINSSTNEQITQFNADSQQSTITVTVDPESQTKGQVVTITGHVYDGMGDEITDGIVYLSINEDLPVEVELTDAGYSYEYTTDIVGVNNVTAEFKDVLTPQANVLIKSSTNDTTFTVDKIATTTTVEILNNTVGNVTIDIKVVGADGNTTMTGDVNITIDGKNYTVNLIDGEENLTVQLSSITTAGDIPVCVEYLGNDNYTSSIANNTDDNKELTNITVVKQNANITLETNVSSCYLGEYVNIFGNLTDGMGNRIPDAYMTVTVDGNEFIVKTNSTGGYTLDYHTDKLGEITVTAQYTGDNYNDATATGSFDVTKIPTTTSVDILNTTLSNVTVEVSVVDVYGEAVDGTIKVYDAADPTTVLTEAQVVDGVANITIPSENTGLLDVIIEYQENDTYLASNATNASLSEDDPYKNITRIDVTGIPTITSVEILNTTLSNVTIKVTVTNQTNVTVDRGSVSILDEEGNIIAGLEDIILDNGEATITLPFDEPKDYGIIVHYNENEVYLASNATNASKEGSPDENITIITVTKIPTKANVTILDTTFNNVTIHVNVTNMTDDNVEDGTITIYDREGNVLVEEYPLENGQADIQIPVETTGELLVIVHYNENDKYMPCNSTNSSSLGALEEITFIEVTKIPTITSVEVISNLINNVTIAVSVTNTSTLANVEKGQVAVYDTDGNELARSDLTDGKADILIPRSVDGIFEVVVKYIENDIYYNSTALNESAEAGRENITVIDVRKIATKTTVEVLNNTIGNVTVHIETTNMTDEAVTKGHVVVSDQNGNIIGEGDLVNGGIDLTLNVTTPTQIGVNVTYNENDIYLSSNARNESLPSGSSDENITYIDVVKQNATITINTNKDAVVIGEDVTIYGTVTDGMGLPIAEGTVNVNINGTVYQTEIKDGLYSLTNITVAAGEYTVNATYLGNDNISSQLSDNVEFTVNKIPTTTTVEILNNTAGNVTIEVTVTNMTGELVNTGEVVIKDADGIITTGTLTGGKATLVIPTENTNTLYVNVSYIENTHYYASNATNSSSTTPEYENVTVIDLVKQEASITIEVVNPSVIMGEVVTIRGQVYDGMGELVTSGDVDVCVDGTVIHASIEDGYYTIENATYTAGVYDVNATYLGSDMVAGVTSETVDFTVNKMPTTTVVEVLNNTAGNVTIDVVVTNSSGEAVTSGQFNITVAGKTVTVDVEDANTTVKLDIADAGDVAVSVAYLENDNYTASTGLDKASGEVLQNITVVLQNASITVNATPNAAIVYQDVTINGTLTDGMANPIADAYVELIINGTSFITKTGDDGVYSLTYIPLNNGTVDVKAVYAGDSRVDNVENTTSFTVDKIATVTSVEILNTTLSNVTIRVNVTNTTLDLVARGSVVVYDTDSNELAKADLTDGVADILIPADAIGPLEVVVKYLENDLYQNSTALNDTAEAGRENITLIDVTRIPTATTVSILDNVAGNVTLEVNVTNMTKTPVSEGEVYVRNASNYDEILATAQLTDGHATIKLDSILESGLIEVVVEYQQNDVYYASNATNESATDPSRENITVIDVQKQSVTITIELSDSSIIISESTLITGQVFDGMGEVIKAGSVTVYVTDEDGATSEKTVEIADDKYSLTYTGIVAGNYTVKAKYLGNASMTPAMSEELNLTVNKIPTITNVTILNTTLGNVTLGINVTNLTPALVNKGTITVKDTSGTVLAEATLTNGMTNVTIPVESIGPLRVIVTYNENNIYAESNATNSSAIGTPDEEIILIDVTRIPTVTTVEILNTTINNVTIGVTVTDMTSTGVTTGSVVVTDMTGKILSNGELTDSYVTLQIPATTSGPIEVIVTYLENDIYYASNATNESATDPARENITVIDVTRLPTITNVEILNTTLGNVTIAVNVTNMTDNLVDRGSVVVYDTDDNILVSDTPLVNGKVNITVPATIGGQL
ncbi:MAG: Ig-like domain repeat protein, partial [Methanosphaera sp.]|nr:Ig-like domain repeat protein [Methanosphaera sp.]